MDDVYNNIDDYNSTKKKKKSYTQKEKEKFSLCLMI